MNSDDLDMMIRRQLLAAHKAGRRQEVVEPLSPSRLDEPLDVPEIFSPAADPLIAIEGYQIQREISRGGQAAVFQAIQESTGRKVAVKVMSGGPYITSSNRARFEREVQVLAALDHPGIVRVVDRGRTADGSFFLAMDYIDGRNLDDYLEEQRRGGVDQKAVLQLFVKIALALDEAHQKGIVHRDLKPSNIRIDGRGEPHILDFGLARLGEQEESGGEHRLTLVGNVVGSMPWASPEQASGDTPQLGPHSDVYSLAVVLYHALADGFPYPVTGTLRQVADNIRELPPAPLREVDPSLWAILSRALAKKPRDRHSHAGELAGELRQYLDGRRIRPRRRWKAAYYFLLVLALACVAGVSLRLSRVDLLGAPLELPRHVNGIGMEFVKIPPGRFMMGSLVMEAGHQADEQRHEVELTRSFYIGRTEVTRRQYRQVMGSLPPGVPEQPEDLPVDRISLDDALEFCRRLGQLDRRAYRLPSEAEWEYACRAGTSTPFAGNGRLKEMGWYVDNSGGTLHPVASRQPNHWGLFDMHGNVSEICGDGYVQFLGYGRQVDPKILPVKTAVVRGGRAYDDQSRCRSASRLNYSGDFVTKGIGFRVVGEFEP
jgi:formylglycine-generating enzyme required for sulfatase activity/tRNA A-37 threonylcarbamoyl transferase component Bud32